jgi:GMC oxidoreductase
LQVFPRLFECSERLSENRGVPGSSPGLAIGNGLVYLTEEVRNRPNLTIAGDVLIDRVLFDQGRAVGVMTASGAEIRADEVLLSAGLYGSPAILLRSGVGPAADLAQLGIAVTHLMPPEYSPTGGAIALSVAVVSDRGARSRARLGYIDTPPNEHMPRRPFLISLDKGAAMIDGDQSNPVTEGSADLRLLDDVDVVRDAVGATCAYGDEDAVVEPRQFGGGGLDGDRGAERVLGGVDVLAGGQAREHVWLAVAYTVRLDVEQRSAVGLEGVADVGDSGAGGPHELPVCAAGRLQFRMEVGALGASTNQRDDAAVALWGVAEVDQGVELGVEAVDVAEFGGWEGGHGRLLD